MEHLLTLLVFSLLHIHGHVGMDIVGGTEAAPHSRPYMAYLKSALCGGALITPTWILTAAHCDVDSSSYAILGAHQLKDTQGQQVLKIKRAIKHPGYKKDVVLIDDLQLLELEEPANLNKFVAVLPLPNRENYIPGGQICSTAGWGLTENRTLSDVLLEVTVTIVEHAVCQQQYRAINLNITNRMMCAGTPNKNVKAGTCVGDSGGPLICDGKYVGLASFGPSDCGNSMSPGIYTRLTNDYLQWIERTISEDDSETYTE